MLNRRATRLHLHRISVLLGAGGASSRRTPRRHARLTNIGEKVHGHYRNRNCREDSPLARPRHRAASGRGGTEGRRDHHPGHREGKPQQGKVIAVGKGKVEKDGKITPLDVKEGDTILFGKYSGQEIKMDGDEYLIMREEEILGVVTK